MMDLLVFGWVWLFPAAVAIGWLFRREARIERRNREAIESMRQMRQERDARVILFPTDVQGSVRRPPAA